MTKVLLLVMATEAITEILVSGDIFSTFREYVWKINKFFGKLINCGYCLSVWVSASLTIPIYYGLELIYLIPLVFAIHRISNIWHELIVKWLKRLPICSVGLNKTEQIIVEESKPNEETTTKTSET